MYVYAQDTNWAKRNLKILEWNFKILFERIFIRKNLIFMKFRRHTSKLDV